VDLRPEDIIALVLLIGSFIALCLGRVTWEQVIPVLTMVTGFYFGIGVGYKRAMKHG